MSSVIRHGRDAAASLQAAVSAVTDPIVAFRRRIDEIRAELSHTRESMVPRAEVHARIREYVQRLGDAWITENGRGLLYGEYGLARPNLKGDPRPFGYAMVRPQDPLAWGALCAAQPEVAIAIMTGLTARVEYEPGPPTAKRRAMIADLEAELAKLEQDEEIAVSEACAHGVTIVHRPEVQARLQAEEARDRRLREQHAEQQQREAALNAQRATAGGRRVHPAALDTLADERKKLSEG